MNNMPIESCTLGKVVRLKSGGPLMTIGSYPDKDGNFYCCYFKDLRLVKVTTSSQAIVSYAGQREEPRKDFFLSGQLVKLKSDGPLMVALDRRQNGKQHCVYADDSHHDLLSVDLFPAQLVPIDTIPVMEPNAAVQRLLEIERQL